MRRLLIVLAVALTLVGAALGQTDQGTARKGGTRGFDANFHLVRDQIGQVHMRDLFLEEYPWRQLLTALTDMRFDGHCFAEIPESADPLRVLRYFRGLFRAYQGL